MIGIFLVFLAIAIIFGGAIWTANQHPEKH
jgi:hypothetical protein